MRHDLTFFVINLGNVEYICVRFRETGEMGLSSPIVPYKTQQYGKLELGLWTASFLDAVERWQEHTSCRRGKCLKEVTPSGSSVNTESSLAPQETGAGVQLDNSSEFDAVTTLPGTVPDGVAGVRDDKTQQSFSEGHEVG
jgi:hypothetical protein